MSETITHQNATTTQDKPVEICVLINSILYFLSCVFIMHMGEKYRLVVLLNNRLLYEGFYNTVRGAKIAFSKLYREKSWVEKVKSKWTPLYQPEKPWLAEKVKIVDKSANG
jgi:hypothetical protein